MVCLIAIGVGFFLLLVLYLIFMTACVVVRLSLILRHLTDYARVYPPVIWFVSKYDCDLFWLQTQMSTHKLLDDRALRVLW